MRLGLSARILAGTAASVVGSLLLALGIAQYATHRAANADLSRSLDQTAARVRDALRAQEQVMITGARSWADVASGVRSTSLAATDSLEPGNGYDHAVGAAAAIGADWAQIVNTAGVRQGKSDEPAAPRDSLAGSALIGQALDGRPVGGFGVLRDSQLFQAVAVPIFGASASDSGKGRLLGAVMAVRYLNDSLAAQVSRGTGSHVAFYAVDRAGSPRVTGADLGDRAAIASFVRTGMAAWTPADSTQSTTGARDATPARGEASVDGKRYLGFGRPLTSVSGRAVGGFVGLRSADEAERSLDSVRNAIVLAAIAGLVLAALSSVLVARHVIGPLQSLAIAARRAAEGDYDAQIPDAGGDEVGTVASAFRSLLADLRDKQALVDVLGGSALALNASTMASAAMRDGQTLRLAVGDANSIAPGRLLAGRYEVRQLLGEGGMGTVYRAHDRELGEDVAIKTLRADTADPSALERFRGEIRLARKISHRNVVRTHDIGEAGGEYYITMELVEGTSLKELIVARGKLPPAAVVSIAKQLCRALEVAHEAGVIHRDIKPQNMVVESDGVLKVMDFGIARLAERAPGQGPTQQGMIVGTPDYMAPEQLMGDTIDPRVDIYAAGVVMYECLTGRLPFQAENIFTLMTRVLEETPLSPAELAGVPRALSDVVMRAMSRDREQRPASAHALHELLERVDESRLAVA